MRAACPPNNRPGLSAPAAGTPRGMDKPEQVVRRLLKVAGTTYAAEAGIRMNDKPMPLFQLLVLCMLASKPIAATTAMRAARELFKAGLRTPKAVLASDRRTMISAFGRAHYVRYDESSATRLTDIAQLVSDEYSGDLRELARSGQHDVAAATRNLSSSRVLATPAPASFCVRSRTSGPGCGRTSTTGPGPPPSGWACPPTRRNWEISRRVPMRGWPPRSSGCHSTTTCCAPFARPLELRRDE